MALRDKLRERAQPFLAPGEQPTHVFCAQAGPSPWLGALSGIILVFWVKYRIVVVTNQSIVILSAKKLWPAKPKPNGNPLARLPRQVVFGPMSGIWGKTEATGEKLYVHKRFHKDAAAADAELGQGTYGMGPQSAPQMPPQSGPQGAPDMPPPMAPPPQMPPTGPPT